MTFAYSSGTADATASDMGDLEVSRTRYGTVRIRVALGKAPPWCSLKKIVQAQLAGVRRTDWGQFFLPTCLSDSLLRPEA